MNRVMVSVLYYEVILEREPAFPLSVTAGSLTVSTPEADFEMLAVTSHLAWIPAVPGHPGDRAITFPRRPVTSGPRCRLSPVASPGWGNLSFLTTRRESSMACIALVFRPGP